MNVVTFIIQLATFLVFFWILYRLAGQTVAGIFRQRTERIETSLHTAEENLRRAEEMQHAVQRQLDQARAEAQGIIDSAGRAAEAQRQALAAQAAAEAEALLQRAQATIQRERQAAVDELRREAGRLAILAASRVVSSSLDSETSRALADRAIADVGRIH